MHAHTADWELIACQCSEQWLSGGKLSNKQTDPLPPKKRGKSVCVCVEGGGGKGGGEGGGGNSGGNFKFFSRDGSDSAVHPTASLQLKTECVHRRLQSCHSVTDNCLCLALAAARHSSNN